MRILNQLNKINNQIRSAEKKYHRISNSVSLLAVSKTKTPEIIREAYNAGQRLFAENYVQEALSKQMPLRDLNIEWHFIGNIQSNKTKSIAENFSWVHSVDRLLIAEKLNHYRSSIKIPLNICIEVNIDQEKTKSGVSPNDVFELAKKIRELCYLKLRGLMVIPTKNNTAAFQKTFLLQQQLIQQGILLDTLSMGMSADFEEAIAAGSTIVRIGTAIFGER